MVSFRLLGSSALAVGFEQFVVSVTSFTELFANQIMICFTSVAHVPWMLSCLHNPSARAAAEFEQILSGYFFPLLFFSQILVSFMSAAHVPLALFLCMLAM